jgi:hypothetical protein
MDEDGFSRLLSLLFLARGQGVDPLGVASRRANRGSDEREAEMQEAETVVFVKRVTLIHYLHLSPKRRGAKRVRGKYWWDLSE